MITGAACTDVYLIAKLSAFGSCCQLAVFYGVPAASKKPSAACAAASYFSSVLIPSV